MSDEPSLPRLPPPAVSWDEKSQRFNRKRVRGSLCSSDPAFFSSDDDPGLDNYVQGRCKKRYVGSWFQQHPESDASDGVGVGSVRPKRKRTLVPVDSGVFLGSDSTDDFDVPPMPASRLPPPASRPPPPEKAGPRVSEAEAAARDRIRQCIERGDESIDFWSMGLEELSDETVSPLATFACIPVVTKDVAFEQKEPELKLYLAMNLLQRLPGALFDLTHLTILSLRGNRLTELPAAISRLRNLRQLNVSQNELRWLPAELLELLEGDLDLVAHPNPFYEPDEPFEPRKEGDPAGRRRPARHLGRSHLQVSDSRGVRSTFTLPQTELVAVDRGAPASADRPSAVPSLVEAALRSCHSSTQLAELQHYMPDGLCHLRRLLERTTRQKEMGGLGCSRCRRLIVVPTVEWIEWRELDGTPSRRDAVPFLHRMCSWVCAMRKLGAAVE
ncbi:Leucine Rich Repeat domain protein [Drechmeria coniospora]|uniref:Leucine Rich Repeat domain protein n=1 Tax=Drechmeria coniospora TaxID=98403 RepID=A0A151GPG8_DRECN|nr:Leucine Rich Repeat domain protein [Drechmeria coniospora]KYK58986.1 Leucine Rich Repeat domain protein [Drechmeria coniospora]